MLQVFQDLNSYRRITDEEEFQGISEEAGFPDSISMGSGRMDGWNRDDKRRRRRAEGIGVVLDKHGI